MKWLKKWVLSTSKGYSSFITDALKHILASSPSSPHPYLPTRECDLTEQRKLSRAWVLMSAYLAWDAQQDIPNSAIESALSPVGDRVRCLLRREGLRVEIEWLESQWADIKMHIHFDYFSQLTGFK